MTSYGSKKECTPGSLGYDASKVKGSDHNPDNTPMQGLPTRMPVGKQGKPLNHEPRPKGGK